MAERDTFVTVSDGDQLNEGYFNDIKSHIENSYSVAGLNHLRQLESTTHNYSLGQNDGWGDTFTTSAGMNNSVISASTNATFRGDLYSTTSSTTSYVSLAIPPGTFSSSITSGIGVPMIAGTESGASVEYQLMCAPVELTNLAEFTPSTLISQVGNGAGLTFGNNDTKLYIADSGLPGVREYNLAVPGDISTASYVGAYDTSGLDSGISCVRFKTDGTKMYVFAGPTERIYQLSLSPAWDATSASSDSKSLTTTEVVSNADFYINNDGDKLWALDSSDEEVHQYVLGTPWDMSTASYDSQFKDVTSESSGMIGLYFSDDEDVMFTISSTSNRVYQYTLGTPGEVSTAVYDTQYYEFNDDYFDGSPQGFAFTSDGKKVAMITSSENMGIATNYTAWTVNGTASIGSSTDGTSYLNSDEISTFTALTSEPTVLNIRLSTKPSSPTPGLPAINGFWVKAK